MLNQREEILKGLAGIAKAEAFDSQELLRSTLIVPHHLNFLEPDILLILGERGAGKSHLFQLVNSPQAQPILKSRRPRRRRPRHAIWTTGFYTRSLKNLAPPLYFPCETVLQRFAQGRSQTDLLHFWRGLLIGAILKQVEPEYKDLLHEHLPESTVQALSNLTQVSRWHSEIVTHLEAVEAALNQLDQTLANQRHFLFVTYDDLDVMALEWPEKRALIQSLLRFWSSQWRRWRGLRPKIFLRLDLFTLEFLQFPDALKLGSHKMELYWRSVDLYQLAFKAWANRNAASLDYLTQAALSMVEDELLGWTYSEPRPSESALRAVVHQMMGQFMGGGLIKGRTFEWIPSQLRDTNRKMVPRSYLNLLAQAAKDELENARAKDNFLLSPLSIARSIEPVSEYRIRELAEEYPWLETLRPIFNDLDIPITRKKFTNLLKGIDWQKEEASRRPSRQTPSEIVDDLLKIGVLRLTSDRRIHVPDIYLYGFKMKRRGGIRRPK